MPVAAGAVPVPAGLVPVPAGVVPVSAGLVEVGLIQVMELETGKGSPVPVGLV